VFFVLDSSIVGMNVEELYLWIRKVVEVGIGCLLCLMWIFKLVFCYNGNDFEVEVGRLDLVGG